MGTEILLTASGNQQCSVCVWDYKSGNTLQLYRNGGLAVQKTLKVLGNDYIIIAEQNKPLLHAWLVNSQDQVKNVRLTLPEPANVLDICPHSVYMAVGIGNKLYIWQLTSGKLLNVSQKHYQPITCIKFSSDGSFLVVAGQDGMLLTYSLGNLVNMQSSFMPQSTIGEVEPLYQRMDHGMSITDLYVGSFGFKSRFATVSNDHTCRVYSLLKGELLITLVLDESLTAVIFDSPCWNLYLGTNSGCIRSFNLRSPPRNVDYHITDKEKEEFSFVGHEKRITCLDLSMSGHVLVSGSEDNYVFIWDAENRQVLRKIDLKAPVTNVMFSLSSENMFAQSFKPEHVLLPLERTLNLDDDEFNICLIQNANLDLFESDVKSVEGDFVGNSRLQDEIHRLGVINKQLYNNCLKKLNEMQ